MNNSQLSIDKQNEFAMKASMILEILNTLMIYVNDPNNEKDQKQKDYKVQIIFNAKELEKYVKVLNPYQENEKVRLFFDGYERIKERINETIKRISNKELEREAKKLHEKIELQAQEMEIKKMLGELKDQYGLEEKDLKVFNFGKTKKSFLAVILEYVLVFVFTALILLGLSGIIPWTKDKNILSLVLFCLYFAADEIVGRLVLNIAFKKLIMQTLGLIMLLPSIVAVVVVAIFPIFVEINSIFLYIITAIFAVAIRKFMLSYVFEKLIKSKFNKMKREEK